MGAKKKDGRIIVSFLGNSTTDVTGSAVSVSYPKDDGTRGVILLECGLVQGSPTIKEQYLDNKKMVEEISKDNFISSITACIICHSHVDHTGNLSILNSDNGFKGKILGSKECLEITKDLVKDSVFIHDKNVKYLKSKGLKVKPLYTEPQMYDMFGKMEEIPVGVDIKLDDNLTITLNNNSHVVGSTNVTLTIRKPNNSIKKIVYSSDMGSNINKPFIHYVKEQEIPQKCNLFISEATYCDSSRQMTKKEAIEEREQLKKIIKESLCSGKRVLFATFAFSRSQEIVTMIYEWFKDEEWFKEIPVIMDGVLMNNVSNTYGRILQDEDKELFNSVMNWNNLKKNRSYEGTIALLSERTVGIYITSSGFLEAGKSTLYVPLFLEHSNDVIIMTGYCKATVEGSIGNQLLDPAKKVVKFDKDKVVLKNATIYEFKTFTSHISHDELLQLYASLNCEKIIVHHSGKAKEKFINEAKEYLRDRNKTTQIIGTSKCCNQFVL